MTRRDHNTQARFLSLTSHFAFIALNAILNIRLSIEEIIFYTIFVSILDKNNWKNMTIERDNKN